MSWLSFIAQAFQGATGPRHSQRLALAAGKLKEEAGTTSTSSKSKGRPSKRRKPKEDAAAATSMPSSSEGTPSGPPSKRRKPMVKDVAGTISTSSTFGEVPIKIGKLNIPIVKQSYQAPIKPKEDEHSWPMKRRIEKRSLQLIEKMENWSQTIPPKPFKVCDVQRSRRVGIVARTLEELRDKIQERIPNLNEGFKVMLEDDCTQIENEEYFQTLPKNSVVIALNGDQAMTDVTSPGPLHGSGGYVEVDAGVKDQSEEHLTRVAQRIARNPGVLAFLPKADLQVVIDADIPVLQVKLMESKDYTVFIQDACERRLIDQIKADEAQDLLNLYHQAKTESGQAKSPKKRLAKTR